MSKVNAKVMETITESLLGNIDVYCETNHDDEVMMNLVKYEEYFAWILEKLIDCAKWKDDSRFSAKECGYRAYMILEDNYEYLSEYMNDWRKDNDI